MKIRIFLATLAVGLAPGIAMAMGGCGWEHATQTASQCGEGQIWDGASQTCITPVTG